MRLGVTLAAVFIVIGLSVAPGAAAVPSLTGEALVQHTPYTGAISGNCTAGTGGSTSYSMDFAGVASGPYPGTFTEHIDATVGPQNTVLPQGPFPGDGFQGGQGPDDFVPAGQLLTLTATFAIDSPAGDVTGTKTLTAVVPADSTHAGTCREWNNEPTPFGNLTGSYEDVRAFDITYDATITTTEGAFPDEGSTDLQARQGRATNADGTVFNVNDLGQSFDSLDDDGDGEPDTTDNCPTDANPSQENNDADAQGDACDPDDDNDGDADTADNCPFNANSGQENNDADADGDACDADDDNDGVPDTGDSCPTEAANTANGCPAPPPPDSDGDGVPDSSDACPNQAANTANGCPAPPPPDSDGDGVPDSSDACPNQAANTANGCPPAPPPDTTAPAVPEEGSARLTRRRLGVRVGPFAEAVSGTVSIRSASFEVTRVGAARRARIRLGPKSFQAAAGQPLNVRFKLSRKHARAVKKLRRLRLTVTIRASDAAGNETTSSFRITLRPKRR